MAPGRSRFGAVNVDRSGATQAGAAARLRAGQPEAIADNPNPKQRVFASARRLLVVQGERAHVSSSLSSPCVEAKIANLEEFQHDT
jgi:hypothetical protein